MTVIEEPSYPDGPPISIDIHVPEGAQVPDSLRQILEQVASLVAKSEGARTTWVPQPIPSPIPCSVQMRFAGHLVPPPPGPLTGEGPVG